MSEKVVPIRVYATVLILLLALTFTTWRVSFIDFKQWNTVIAIAIAVFKAAIVALYFMHLRYSPKLMRIVLVASLFWLGIMLSITMADYLTRSLRYPANP
jgi:cytochrome c oxidase subunit 4